MTTGLFDELLDCAQPLVGVERCLDPIGSAGQDVEGVGHGYHVRQRHEVPDESRRGIVVGRLLEDDQVRAGPHALRTLTAAAAASTVRTLTRSELRGAGAACGRRTSRP